MKLDSRAIILIVLLVLVPILSITNLSAVQAASPQISVNRTSGPPGFSVGITGSGFSSNETGIAVTFDSTLVVSGIIANSSGNWNSSFTVPSVATGLHNIGAFGSVTPVGSVPVIVFMVVNPSITISLAVGPPGTLITVTGSGFGANEQGITITFDGTAITSGITANSAGAWTGTLIIPASSPGTHAINAYGPVSVADFVPSVTFVVPPRSLAITPISGPPGTQVSVSGSGFGAGETGIAVLYDGNSVASGISADAAGNWKTTFLIPASVSGPHSVTAYGSITLLGTAPTSVFRVTPVLTLSRASGPPGTQITVTGSGFGSNETGITITFDGNPVTPGTFSTSLGNWSATLIIPDSASGPHTISAFGSLTTSGTAPPLTFTVSAAIAIGSASGPPGTSITVSGSGFSASEAGIIITFDGTGVSSGTSANSLGSWKSSFIIPASAFGPHSVSAYGSVTPAGSAPGITFLTSPITTASPTTGPPGTVVTVTGSGFGNNEKGITITYDGKPAASGIPASALGSWSSTLTIPASTVGPHAISATSPVTQASNIGGTSFDVIPSVTLSATSGYVGQTIQINGLGYAANSPLSLTYDDEQIPAQGITTDGTGSFSRSFVLPKSKAGNHVVTVVDSQRNSAKANFNMDSTPPPVPNPISPQDGTRIGILGNITPTFTWSTVSDPSGVVYSLQIATDSDFSQLVLEKTNITATRYTLAASEVLPRGQYYWRVKAIDGASNESTWSQARLLKAGLMPLWELILIILLSVAAAAGIAYFILVRFTPRRFEFKTVPKVTAPRIVQGQFREIESVETPGAPGERQLPWRLALPEPSKGAKLLSTEDRARLKVIIDFTQSLPLLEPDYTVNWIVDLIETKIDNRMSPPVYEQLLKGELQVRYEPAWMHHPAYQDLTTLLQGQSILRELEAFINDVNHCASEAVFLLQQIYNDVLNELPPTFLKNGGWSFISSIYSDAVSWFIGKSLNDPSERDYIIKPVGSSQGPSIERWLYGEENTSFAGEIVRASDNGEALRLQALHLKERRSLRNSNQSRQVAAMITKLQLQRSQLLSIFSQFGQLKQ